MQLSSLKQYEQFYEAIKPAEENSDQAFAWFSDVPHWLFNAVMHLSCENVEEKVDDLIGKAPAGNPISFWLHPQNSAPGLAAILQERGFGPIITCPLMAWPVHPIQGGKGDIRLADLGEFLDILAVVYQFDEPVRRAFEKVMKQLKGCENYIIFMEGKAVGTGTLLINGSVGGIFNDATLADRREASQPLMQFLMKRARELRLKQLVLLSSPEAEELYGRLGFEKIYDIEVYSR